MPTPPPGWWLPATPRAVHAALRCLRDGGNAADAAVVAAAVLAVVEPMSTGIGGDAFALVWRDGELTGLNGSGRAPATADPDALGGTMPFTGPQSVTVPGAVAGWQALLERHGTWPLDRCLGRRDRGGRGRVRGGAGDRRACWQRVAPDLAAYEDAAEVFLPAPAGRLHVPQPGSSRRRCGGSRPTARTASTAARWRRRSRPPRGSRWTTSPPCGRTGSSRCARRSAAPPSASCRRTARAPPRCRRWAWPATSTSAAQCDVDRVHLQAEAMKLAFADAYRYISEDPLPARLPRRRRTSTSGGR